MDELQELEAVTEREERELLKENDINQVRNDIIKENEYNADKEEDCNLRLAILHIGI